MSIIEDQLLERQEALQEHLEKDAENNRKIMVFLRAHVKNEQGLGQVEQAIQSGSDQTFDFGELKVAIGFDGLYHVLQRGEDGKFHAVELPNPAEEIQRAA